MNIIKKIFNGKIKLTKQSDIIKLSQYSDIIPMYDIYSDTIIPVPSKEINYRLLKCHYRFITDEVKQWIKNKLDKSDNKIKYIDNLHIIDNYDMETLEKTSYETLYRNSPELGLSISICKRNSFNPFSTHLTPYYTKNELIKLGMNNKIIKNIDINDLIDKTEHYKICKKVSKNDISYKTIIEHMRAIIENNCIGWIQYYSMTGSYVFNKILRENLPINRYMYDGLKNIIDTMNSISLPNKYYFYRFIWDDIFIKNLKIGDTFMDNGFISTTRDPFYSPGIKMDFGLILIRINIPSKMKGIGLLVENFSMFPKEEEFLIAPFVKFKLVAKNDTTYYHVDEKFEKLIKKKYEFDLVSKDISKDIEKHLKNLNIVDDNTIPSIDISNIRLDSMERFERFNQFIKQCDIIGQYMYKNMIYICQFFDSTGSYQNMYYNKTKDGMIHTHSIDGNIILSIECGDKLVVNYLKTKCSYDNNIMHKNIENVNEIISMYCKLFGYTEALVFFEYNNFIEFKDNYIDNTEFLSTNLYCKTIYDYIKNNIHTDIKYYKFNYGFWKLDKIFKLIVPNDIIILLKNINISNNITWGQLYIIIVEKHFYLYNKMEEWFNSYHDNLFKQAYYTFNPIIYFKSIGREMVEIPNLKHIITRDRGDLYRNIYEESSRIL